MPQAIHNHRRVHGRAPKPHDSYSGTERSSNGGSPWLSRPPGHATIEERVRIEADGGKAAEKKSAVAALEVAT
jgi:hypothetical protein